MEVAKIDQIILNIMSQLKYQKKQMQENIERIIEQSQKNSHMGDLLCENNTKIEKETKLTEKKISALQYLNDYLLEIKKKNMQSQNIIDNINYDIKDVNRKIKELKENI